MVFIRSKAVKGDKYLYLVKSVWDSKKSTSRQEIIKYLGKATEVKSEDIPIDYRNNPKIEAFLASNTGKGILQNEKLILKLRDSTFKALTTGDLDKVIDIFETYTKSSTLGNFYENILKPTMYEIGKLWADNKLSIADEHVASNIASELVSIITEKNSKLQNKAKILICSPNGEEHNIGCSVLQSFLQSKGYRVFNLSPSVPSEAITHFAKESKPDLILISITIEDNIKTGQRLVKKIQEEYKVPILVGGQALENNNTKFACNTVVKEPLEKILKIIKDEIRII